MTATTRPARPAAVIAVNCSPAMSGYFATLYDYSWMEDESKEHGGFWFPEPYATGFGRYATWEEANAEGEQWAAAEGLEFQPATQERVDRAKAETERLRARTARIRELREQGLDFRTAHQQAKGELG